LRVACDIVSRDGWLRIELRHLVALEAVASEGSFRAAADSLGYVQSAVSQQISFLERVIGARLVERSRGPGSVRLTASGEIVRASGAAILDRLDQAHDAFCASACHASEPVRVGVPQGIAGRLLPHAIGELRRRGSDVAVALVELDFESCALDLLAEGDVELAIAGLPVDDDAFDTEALLDAPCVLVAPRDWPVARLGRPPSAGELADIPLIVFEGADSVGRPPTYEPHVVCRTRSTRLAVEMAARGLGGVVLPVFAVAGHDDRVAVVSLDPAPRRQVGVAWRQDRWLPPTVDEVRDALRHVSA
jgi:DNA-binding transcriptional LysR family regulator